MPLNLKFSQFKKSLSWAKSNLGSLQILIGQESFGFANSDSLVWAIRKEEPYQSYLISDTADLSLLASGTAKSLGQTVDIEVQKDHIEVKTLVKTFVVPYIKSTPVPIQNLQLGEFISLDEFLTTGFKQLGIQGSRLYSCEGRCFLTKNLPFEPPQVNLVLDSRLKGNDWYVNENLRAFSKNGLYELDLQTSEPAEVALESLEVDFTQVGLIKNCEVFLTLAKFSAESKDVVKISTPFDSEIGSLDISLHLNMEEIAKFKIFKKGEVEIGYNAFYELYRFSQGPLTLLIPEILVY